MTAKTASIAAARIREILTDAANGSQNMLDAKLRAGWVPGKSPGEIQVAQLDLRRGSKSMIEAVIAAVIQESSK